MAEKTEQDKRCEQGWHDPAYGAGGVSLGYCKNCGYGR